MKVYKCIICHKELDYKPTRLVKQVYGAGRFNQFYPVEFYDFCEECFKRFSGWIKKNRREDER